LLVPAKSTKTPLSDDNPQALSRRKLLAALWAGVPPSFIAPALLTLALTITFIFVSERNYHGVTKSVDERRLARDNLEVVASLETLLLNAETGQRGYLLTGNADYLEPMIKARTELSALQQKMSITFADRPDRKPYVEKLAALVVDKFIELEMTVSLAQSGRRAEALEIVQRNNGKSLMDEAKRQIDIMVDKMEDELDLARTRTQSDMLLSRIGALTIAILNLLLLAFALYLFIKDLKQRQQQIAIRENENNRLQILVAERTVELSELSTHLQRSTEQDRAALARDLHDELGGILTSAAMDVNWLMVHATQEPETLKRYHQLSMMLNEAVSIKRRVIENLRPSLLDNLGLAPALEWYIAEQCSKGGINCTLNLAEELGYISPDAAIALFRIVQEGTTNTLRHAQAKNFTAHLHVDAVNIHLTLQDDGAGLPATFNPAKLSHGLSGIRQRARSLGGNAVWRSSLGGGTTIEVIIPREVNVAQA
jgi:signal transduction histidine kinase